MKGDGGVGLENPQRLRFFYFFFLQRKNEDFNRPKSLSIYSCRTWVFYVFMKKRQGIPNDLIVRTNLKATKMRKWTQPESNLAQRHPH